MTARILVVDNRDSFVHTLVSYLRELDAEVDVTVDGSSLDGYDGVLISPGPGAPEDATTSRETLQQAVTARMPVLGVCLGHQIIAVAFGGRVSQAPQLRHGMASQVRHDGTGLFEGVPSPFAAGRYHSLAALSLPETLVATAHAEDGTIMALAHRDLPIEGVQFHPESVLTEGGHRMLSNWLSALG